MTMMRIFSRKSPWDRFLDNVLGTVSRDNVRKTAKVAAGVTGGAVTAIAMSAAATAARKQEQK